MTDTNPAVDLDKVHLTVTRGELWQILSAFRDVSIALVNLQQTHITGGILELPAKLRAATDALNVANQRLNKLLDIEGLDIETLPENGFMTSDRLAPKEGVETIGGGWIRLKAPDKEGWTLPNDDGGPTKPRPAGRSNPKAPR